MMPGLPPVCGFGYRGQVGPIAAQVAALAGSSFTSWAKVREQIAAVDLLMPEDFDRLEQELANRGLNILRSLSGRPAQVGR